MCGAEAVDPWKQIGFMSANKILVLDANVFKTVFSQFTKDCRLAKVEAVSTKFVSTRDASKLPILRSLVIPLPGIARTLIRLILYSSNSCW
jgi:hypothetical protein